MNEVRHVTKFLNRTKEPVKLWDGPEVIVRVPPGEISELHAASLLALYARWDEIVFHSDGRVDLHERKDWVEPDRGRWVVKIINIDGAECEEVVTLAGPVFCPRGIPVLVGVAALDPLAMASEVRIERIARRFKSTDFPGYLFTKTKLSQTTVDRDPAEMEKLLGEIESLAETTPSKAVDKRPVFGIKG